MVCFLCFRQRSTITINVVERHVKSIYSIQNRTSHVIQNAILTIRSPSDGAISNGNLKIAASHGYTMQSEANGNNTLKVTLPPLPPFSIELVRIDFEMTLTSKAITAKEASSNKYLEPTRYVQAAHPSVKRLAVKLKQKGQVKYALALYDWVSQNVRYEGFLKRERGALYALTKKRGDCTEYMDLFVALCRAAGIPARCVGGYVASSDGPLSPSDYHNWAEFFDGNSWQIADPQKRRFMSHQEEYIAIVKYSGSEILGGFSGQYHISDKRLKVRLKG